MWWSRRSATDPSVTLAEMAQTWLLVVLAIIFLTIVVVIVLTLYIHWVWEIIRWTWRLWP